jgi:hypothetical protein
MRGLKEGWFTAHPHEVVPGGLNGVEQGLKNLKDGVNMNIPIVFRVNTPGMNQEDSARQTTRLDCDAGVYDRAVGRRC